MILEKDFSLMEYGVEHDINRYLAAGWKIKHHGITLLILEKEFPEVEKENEQ